MATSGKYAENGHCTDPPPAGGRNRPARKGKRKDSMNKIWQQMCEAADIDPQQRLAAREAILGNPEALECTLYRPDENDPDAEEEDLGDARILFTGAFQAPAEWDAEACEEFFGDDDPALFVTALIEAEAEPGSSAFFLPDVGDYVAVIPELGEVAMYYVHDWHEDESGRSCVLIRDDQPLD